MSHLRTVLAWSGISTALLLMALLLCAAPDNAKGKLLCLCVFLTLFAMMVKICRGSP